MQQKINLYSFLPKPKKEYFTVETVLLSYAAFLIFLLVFYFFEVGRQEIRIDNIEKTTALLEKTQQKLIQVSTQYPLINPTELTGSIKYLDEQLALQKKILHEPRFSIYFAGLAKSIVPGVWLTRILISNEGERIQLQGHAITEIAAQRFLEALITQPIFARLKIELHDLTRSKNESDDKSIFDFSISNQERRPS